ncbi:MAG TPA: ABC transporter ATP-binding protein [Candidatus Dormibacteraeota bacterium]|nr:ABC transporter ATP-binding protein [Candidatus Dormibacteraeota bacterium]
MSVKGVGKRFRYRSHGWQRAADEHGQRRLSFRRDAFWALREITFEVGPGTVFGIIGPNGAGKSTLLRLVGGVGTPTNGAIRVQGRVGAMLELGSDFHPELTGRENATLSGIISGLTRRQVTARMSEIIEFAGLSQFIDSPVRMYSAGMLLRLAFAIAVNTDPEVLLIDEVLAVGDVTFQRKCLAQIEHLRRQGCAILVSTHDTEMAAQLCDQVMWLRKGVVVQLGNPADVVSAYMMSTDRETRSRTPGDWQSELTSSGVQLKIMENRFGSMELRITDVRMLDTAGFRTQRILRGEPLRIEIDYFTAQTLPAPNFGVLIRKADETVLFDGYVSGDDIGIDTVSGYGGVALNLHRLDLNSGDYHVDIGVYTHDWAYAYDYHWRAYPLTVWAASAAKGLVNPPHAWEASRPRRASR